MKWVTITHEFMEKCMTIARHLADFVNGTETIPEATRTITVSAIFDLLTAAVVGFDSAGGRAARHAAKSIWGSGPAQSWFSTDCLTGPGTAFANAAIASMLDLDDGHRAAAGHPGASVIPAVFATADVINADADRVLTAIALGYEIAVRIAASRELDKLDTLVSGPWCGQGAAAAAAWLDRLPAPQIAEAIAIAGASAPNLAAVAYSQVMGNHLKEGIPWATTTGLAATNLAACGFTGPLDFLDNPRLYDAKKLTDGLGDDWYINGIYFKPYSCCRWAHAAIDALMQIQQEEKISSESIQKIEVHTFARALQLNNDTEPLTLEAAQYSVPFCLALAAVRGTEALLPLREESLNDRTVLALARRVTLSIDPDLDAMFSSAVPARLEVTIQRGRFVRTVIAPKGEPSNPMTKADLRAKFDVATYGLIEPRFANCLVEAIEALGNGDIKPLRIVLATPMIRENLRPVEGVMVQSV